MATVREHRAGEAGIPTLDHTFKAVVAAHRDHDNGLTFDG
jgi:hypothetical protein